MGYTEGLPALPGTHEARRFPRSLTWQEYILASYLEAGLAVREYSPRGEEPEYNGFY